MIILNYSKYDVLAMYVATNPGDVNPTATQIARFDQDLFDTINAILVEVLASEGLPLDKTVRSTVLLYSRSGAGTDRQNVRAACEYFRNTSML